MNRITLLAHLSALETFLDQRVNIWRSIIDEQGREIGRIYRGSFQRSPTSESSKGERAQ